MRPGYYRLAVGAPVHPQDYPSKEALMEEVRIRIVALAARAESGEAEALEGVTVFHAGTALVEGKLATAGGRVLGATALGDTLAAAQARAYEAVSKIHFEGASFRRDIAAKGL